MVCETKPLPRCAGHAGPALRESLQRFRAAFPGEPDPCVLLAAESQIGRLHAHVATAQQWVRDAASEQERQEAERYLTAARARLRERWAERDGTARAAALSADDQQAWDQAEKDWRYCEERCGAHEMAADAAWGIDDARAEHHDAIAARYRAEAEQHAATQTQILAGARARRSAPAPVPTPTGAGYSDADDVHDAARAYGLDRLEAEHQRAFDDETARETAVSRVEPRHAELDYLRQHQPASYALNESEVRHVLGTDRAGLAALEQTGSLPLATDAGSGRVAMYRLGDVARVARLAAELERIAA